MRPPFFVATVGDPNSIRTHSGKPYFLLQAGLRSGIFTRGLELHPESLRVRKVLWRASRLLTARRPFGFQYSSVFLESLWRPVLPLPRPCTVISLFQLLPPSVVRDREINKWFFIDQTLSQLLAHHPLNPAIPVDVQRDALEREREGYAHSDGVLTHSRWAATELIDVYGLPPGKVHVVPLAACIAESDYEDWEQQQIEKLPQMERALLNGEPLRLVLVGKDWHNKGLDRLLEAMKIGASRGLTATLLVIGCCEDDLPVELRGMPGVTYRGRLDKATASREFVDAVGECHIGCLLSRAEAAGIAVREYQALGLAVLGTDAGGSPEQIIPGAGIIVPRAAPPVEIANILLRLDADRPLLARMRSVAWENRTAMLWTTAFPKVSEILAVTSASRSVRCG